MVVLVERVVVRKAHLQQIRLILEFIHLQRRSDPVGNLLVDLLIPKVRVLFNRIVAKSFWVE